MSNNNNNIQRHSRGTQIAGQKTGGQFKTHERADAVFTPPTTQEPDWHTLAMGEEAQFGPTETGLEHLHPNWVTAQRDETGEIRATVGTVEAPIDAGIITQQQMDRGYALIIDELNDRYSPDSVEILDDEEVDRIHLVFGASMGNRDRVHAGEVGDAIQQSQLPRFINETDQGTTGAPYFWGDITTRIEDGFFPHEDYGEHSSRIDIEAAQDAAGHAVRGNITGNQIDPETFPQLHMLRERGYLLDPSAALKELDHASRTHDTTETATVRRLRHHLFHKSRQNDQRKRARKQG